MTAAEIRQAWADCRRNGITPSPELKAQWEELVASAYPDILCLEGRDIAKRSTWQQGVEWTSERQAALGRLNSNDQRLPVELRKPSKWDNC